jgi:hypothetical protein
MGWLLLAGSADGLPAVITVLAKPQTTRFRIWWSQPVSLLCSVNDVVNVLPYATCDYLNVGPVLTCAALTGRR